jgi:hypothetical protein
MGLISKPFALPTAASRDGSRSANFKLSHYPNKLVLTGLRASILDWSPCQFCRIACQVHNPTKSVFLLDIGTGGAKVWVKLRLQQAISERRL